VGADGRGDETRCPRGAEVLTAFGVYGLLSYTVAQRRGEIAIRMALGAGRRQILLLVVGQGAAIVGVGALLGMGAAAVSSQMWLHLAATAGEGFRGANEACRLSIAPAPRIPDAELAGLPDGIPAVAHAAWADDDRG